MVNLGTVSAQNPWWFSASAVDEDPHLVRLGEAAVELRHPVESSIRLDRSGIYVLRGPRQIGKTTLLKKLVRNHVTSGNNPKEVFYLALDVADVRSQTDLVEAIRIYMHWTPASSGRKILLDEITYCQDWSVGLKAAFDIGLLKEDLVIATGSHALDLRKGQDRLAGRRGQVEAESDQEMGPFPFSSIVQAGEEGATHVVAGSWKGKELVEAAEENQARTPWLADALDRYLIAGGMPMAVNELERTGKISASSAAVYLQSVLGDLMRAGKKEEYIRDLVGAVVTLGGESVDWHGLSQRLAFGSKNTIADYLDVLERAYLLTILPQPTSLGSSRIAPRKPRKIHVRDPYLQHVFESWASGMPDPWETCQRRLSSAPLKGRLVEALVAGQLLGRFERLLHWRGREEIDLIGLGAGGKSILIEVKYQAHIRNADLKVLNKHGGGVLISRDALHWDGDARVAVVPLRYFLLSLPSR